MAFGVFILLSPASAFEAGSPASAREGVLDARSYGAHCDGVTDNSDALQGWLDDVAKTRLRGHLPGCANVYAYSRTLRLDKPGFVDVNGDGPRASRLLYTGARHALEAAPPTLVTGYVRIARLGLRNLTKTKGFAGYRQTRATATQLVDVGLANQDVCVEFGPGSWAARVIDAELRGCGADGGGGGIVFADDKSANNAQILRVRVSEGGGPAIVVPNGDAINIEGVDLEANHSGVVLGGGRGGVTSVTIRGGAYIEKSGPGGNLITRGQGDAIVRSLSIAATWLGESPTDQWKVDGLTLSGVTLYNYAPVVTAGSKGTFSGLVLAGTGALTWAPGAMTTALSPRQAAALPKATGYLGSTGMVTDARRCQPGEAVSGGGALVCPVYSDGSSWMR